MFSPLRWITKNTQGWSRNSNNEADLYGDPSSVQEILPVPNDALSDWWSGYPSMYPVTPGNLTATDEVLQNNDAGRTARAQAARSVTDKYFKSTQVNNVDRRFAPVVERARAFAEGERERGRVEE
jgi:hypothetical protein